MKEVHPVPIWDQPVESLSPLDLAPRVATSVQIRMMVGAEDNIAPPPLTQVYADRLLARGVAVQVTLLPNKGHEILLEPAVEAALEDLVAAVAAQKGRE